MFLPRMLLHRPPGGGLIPRSKLVAAKLFPEGSGSNSSRPVLLAMGRRSMEESGNVVEKVAMAWSGVSCGRRNWCTLVAASWRQGQSPHETNAGLPSHESHSHARSWTFSFRSGRKKFGRNFRSARRGVAGEPSGMTCEHLRPLLDEVRSMHILFRFGENLARAHVPPIVVHMVKCGRMTALANPDGGIVCGDVLRRLVALQGLCDLNPRQP